MFGRAVLAAAAFALAIGAPVSGSAAEHIVRIVSDYDNMRMAFSPKTLIIEPGDTVVWVNEVAEEHNVVSYPDGYPKSANPLSSHYLKKAGERWSFTFQVKGSYEYHCIPHLPMGMHGTVIVTRPSHDAEFHVPSIEEMKKYTAKLRDFFSDEEFKYRPRNERHKREAARRQ